MNLRRFTSGSRTLAITATAVTLSVNARQSILVEVGVSGGSGRFAGGFTATPRKLQMMLKGSQSVHGYPSDALLVPRSGKSSRLFAEFFRHQGASRTKGQSLIRFDD